MSRFLSHYTTRQGLEGIVKTGTFWATNFLQLNDPSEFFYSWQKIQKSAFEYVQEKLPSGFLSEKLDAEKGAAECAEQFRRHFESTNGYENLYVTSFSQSDSDDSIGNLTLWKNYAKLDGYCLQFDVAHMDDFIEAEKDTFHYHACKIAKINYGIDENSKELRDLSIQLGEQQLLGLQQEFNDNRIKPNFQIHERPSVFSRMIMEYCASHKDPAFIDERETRILAYPAEGAVMKMWRGIIPNKQIHCDADKPQKIILGDRFQRGIEPRRIIIGPKADPDLSSILCSLKGRPEIIRSDIPVR